jgi:hypothetical protein
MSPDSTPKPPPLPEVDSPPAEDVLAAAPSVDEILGRATPAEQIIDEQPAREELTGSSD